jgi:hypothetical protein
MRLDAGAPRRDDSPMRATLPAPLAYAFALALAVALLASPATAHADALGCLVGPSDSRSCSVGGTPAALLAAIAVPVLVAGAAVSIADELGRHTHEQLPDGAAPAAKRPPATLSLVPTPPDPYRAAAGPQEARHRPNGAFRFNEIATNATTVVAGAMVAGAVIATIVHAAHK